MKSTGIVRKVDTLGRIVLPMELRRQLGIEHKDGLEIFIEGDQIRLKKYAPNQECIITGEIDENNKVLADGKVIVSPEGALTLHEQLEEYIEQYT